MKKLKTTFDHRDALIAYVAEISQQPVGKVSWMRGDVASAQATLAAIQPTKYGSTRNYLIGAVTRLSPYIHHGMITLDQVKAVISKQVESLNRVEKLMMELAWRDFWQRLALQHPKWLWQDIEHYKTGFSPDDYDDRLPEDISTASTGVACIDEMIAELIETGYLHNHARMYLASYIVHWRRIKWQVGAQWFLTHLLDGDIASNNFSWQWIASTFSHKPYFFNLENVHKYAQGVYNTDPHANQVLDGSYAEISKRLFPHLKH